MVAFSWWGVNMLETGLHAYGFIKGANNVILWFYGFEGAVILLGAGYAIWEKLRTAEGPKEPPPASDLGPEVSR